MKTAKTQTKDRLLVDDVHESPVDLTLFAFRRGVVLVLLALLLIVLVALGFWLLRDDPVVYGSDTDHFKYGSIGSEPGGSVLEPVGGVLPPYDIFRALPAICPEKLPGGYASLGLIFETGKDLPIGVSKRHRLGFDQVGLNCASCHTGTYRAAADARRQVVLGMPAHQLNLQGLFDFVTSCTLDERFTADNVIGRIEQAGGHVGPVDRYIYRSQIVPTVRESTLRLRGRVAMLIDQHAPQWGAGRVDTFNPYKAIQFNWRLDMLPPGELVGAADFPPLWNQKPREHMHLHWDGNNDSVDERNLSASLGAGVTPRTIDHAALQRIRNWIWTLPPPAYPFPIDPARAASGKALYEQHCANCHGGENFRDGVVPTAGSVGQVTPIAQIGTDVARLDAYTEAFAEQQYTLYPESSYRFTHFRKTFGYANQPLDGIWARAPYLHNGSVPTLRDLLDDPGDRPKAFYRGYDVFDQRNVGFVHDVPAENGRPYFKFDTALPGNGNGGHVYGTRLSAAEKDAIVEYMKAF